MGRAIRKTIVVNTCTTYAQCMHARKHAKCVHDEHISGHTITYIHRYSVGLASVYPNKLIKHKMQNPRRVTKHHQSHYTYHTSQELLFARAHIHCNPRAYRVAFNDRALHVQITCEVLT